MPPITKIIKFGLESRTRELYHSNIPYQKIADTLSNESGHNITKAMVFQFLKNDSNFAAEVIEKKNKLGVKIAEAEISTIEGRLSVIEKLLEVFETCKTKQEYSLISKEIRDHYDSLDKRIGKTSSNPNVTINNVNAMRLTDVSTEDLMRMV